MFLSNVLYFQNNNIFACALGKDILHHFRLNGLDNTVATWEAG